MKQYPFKHQLPGIKIFGGGKYPDLWETIWKYPKEKFTYGKFNLQDIE